MEKANVTFLGTSASIPTLKRNHSSIFIQYKKENILIDCGENTQIQLKKAKISPNKINRILLTHWHGDHVLGLPGLLQTLSTNNYLSTLEIYGPKGIKKKIEGLLDIYNIQLNLNIIETSSKIYEDDGILISASPMKHTSNCNAYSFTIKEKRRIDKKKLKSLKLENSPLLKKISEGKDVTINNKKIKASSLTYLEKPRKFSVILDSAYNQNAVKFVKNSDVLICESTFLEEEKDKAKERLHLTAKQAAMIAKKSKSSQLILTHISERYEASPELILNEAKSTFKNSSIAYDLKTLEF